MIGGGPISGGGEREQTKMMVFLRGAAIRLEWKDWPWTGDMLNTLTAGILCSAVPYACV